MDFDSCLRGCLRPSRRQAPTAVRPVRRAAVRHLQRTWGRRATWVRLRRWRTWPRRSRRSLPPHSALRPSRCGRFCASTTSPSTCSHRWARGGRAPRASRLAACPSEAPHAARTCRGARSSGRSAESGAHGDAWRHAVGSAAAAARQALLLTAVCSPRGGLDELETYVG